MKPVRSLKRVLAVLGCLVLLLVLAVTAAVGWLQTDSGKSFAASEISRLGSTPGQQIEVTGLTGSVPFDIGVGRIALADKDGEWLVLRGLRLHVQPLALFSRRLHIAWLGASAIDMARAPSPQADEKNPEKTKSFHLPLRIELDRLAIRHIGLGASLTGTPAILALDAHGNATARSADVALNLRRVDGQSGLADLRLSYDVATNSIKLAAAISEPSGVLFDTVLKRQDHLPLTLTLDGNGPLSAWQGKLALSAGEIARLDSTLFLEITGKRQRYAADLSLSDKGLLPEPFRDLIQPATLKLEATKEGDDWSVPALALRLQAATLSGSAAYATDTRAVKSSLTARSDLSTLQALAGRPLGGALVVNADLSGTVDDLKIAGLAALTDLKIAGLPDDLGRAASLKLKASVAESGRNIAIDDATLTMPGAVLAATGRKDDQSSAGRVTARIEDLSRFSALAGRTLAGSLDASADIAGKAEDLSGSLTANGVKLALGTVTLDSLTLDANLPSLAAKSGDLSLRFVRPDLNGSFAAKIGRPDDRTIALSGISLKAKDTSLSGNLAVDTADKRANGALALSIPDLGAWSGLAGTALAGKIDGRIALAVQNGQSVGAELHAANLAIASTTLAALDVSAKLANVTGKPTGTATLTATTLHAGSAVLDSTTAKLAAAAPGQWKFGIATGGTATEPFKLAASGMVQQAAQTLTLTVASLTGHFERLPIQLRVPFTATRRGENVETNRLALGVGSATLAGTGSLKPAAVALNLATSGVSLAEFGPVFGQPTLGGHVDFDLSLSGKPSAPGGLARLTVSDFDYDTASPQAKANLFAAGLIATLGKGRVALAGTVAARQGLALKLAGEVPARLSLQPFALGIDEHAPVAADVTGSGKFADLAASLPIGEDRVAGSLAVDAHVRGTLAAPVYSGHLRVADGRYDNQALGTQLRDVTLDLAGDNQRVTLASLRATDGADGTVKASGDVSLAAGVPHTLNIAGAVHDFLLTRSEEATVRADGMLEVTGTVSAPLVRLRATIPRADLAIPGRMPSAEPTLTVVRIDSRHPVRKGTDADAPPLITVGLDVQVDVPGQCFVRGRGLDSTWAGRIAVTGTAAAPVIAGQLRTVSGTLSALGKDFKLTRGLIVFEGGKSVDPRLDVEATASASGITARIDVTGTASLPKIALNSDPPMPQDEILSHVLFGENASQVSAAEGVQLAEAAASLAGGGGLDVFDRLRQSTGLDRLGLADTASATSTSQNQGALSGTAISGGKYIANGVFLGVQQGLTAGSSAAKLEVEVAPNVTVNGTVGSDSSSGLGVTYTLDY